MIDRDTAWRQGSLLKSEELHHLQVEAADNFAAVVISHDCDIPNEAEATIELIICKQLEPNKVDHQLCNARNVRRLHLPYNVGGRDVHYELSFQKRVVLDRAAFARDFSFPNETHTLSDASKRVLKQWLAIRYGRPAYPNAFENRLRIRISKKEILERKLAKLIEPRVSILSGIWVDLDTDKNVELPPEDPYFLQMYLVYKTDGDLQAARAETETLAGEITELFNSAYTGDLDQIVLDRCAAVAETSFSLADIMRTDQWRVEHISLSANDDSFVPTGA